MSSHDDDNDEYDNEQILFSHFHPPFTPHCCCFVNLLHLCMKSYMNQNFIMQRKSHKFPLTADRDGKWKC